jgi:acyl-CoA synthetase (AMP-forming)/AMP-acid ligase II
MNVATRFIDAHVQAGLGHKPALELTDKHYSYNDLAALANRAGNLLKACGVRPGDRVLILMPPSPGWVGSVIGAMKIGAVPALAPRATPKLAIVHAAELGKAGSLAKENVVVAGDAPGGYKSFLELMRAQSSSLPATDLPAQAPALAVADRELSHAELERLLGDATALGKVGEVLGALSKAETAKLS